MDIPYETTNDTAEGEGDTDSKGAGGVTSGRRMLNRIGVASGALSVVMLPSTRQWENVGVAASVAWAELVENLGFAPV